MKRRRFLALSGAAVTGIWVAGTGLIHLNRRMVMELSGRCSFCGKTCETIFGLAGVVERSERICNECVEICLEILKDDLIEKGRHSPLESDAQQVSAKLSAGDDFTITEMLQHGASPQSKAELERALKELREMLSQREAPRLDRYQDELACTFCDGGQSAVAKLIGGPSSVYICDGCSGEAAVLLLMHA